MSYVINGVDRSAAGLDHGVAKFTAHVDLPASLADIDWMPPGSTATDNAATVYQKDPLTGHWVLPAATPILITTQPVDVSTTAGEITESLVVAAYAQDSTGAHACTYQWYSNNSKDYDSPSEVVGATSATMALGEALAAGTYYYFCTVTANSKTLNSAIATVTVAAGE